MLNYIHPFLPAILLLGLGCASGHDYSGEEAAIAKDRAAHAHEPTVEREGSRIKWPREVQDSGAETARAKSSKVLGIEETAARRVFVFDASGSMASSVRQVQTILNSAVDAIDSQTAFSIIFFEEDYSIAMEGHWMMADTAGKRQAKEFINDIQLRGSTDPLPGIRQAFTLEPEVIYLGTDGDFPNNHDVLVTFRTLNFKHKVKVNTILLGNDGPEVETLLKQIASESGGRFVRVNSIP